VAERPCPVGTTAAVGSVGGDTPTALIAATRNRTATPAVKPRRRERSRRRTGVGNHGRPRHTIRRRLDPYPMTGCHRHQSVPTTPAARSENQRQQTSRTGGLAQHRPEPPATRCSTPRMPAVAHLAGSSPRLSVSPWPSCPKTFRPQHLTVSLSSSAHVWKSPAVIADSRRDPHRDPPAPGIAHLTGAVTTRVAVTLAELPEGVQPPALDGVVVEQRTRMEVAGRDRDRGATRTEAHRPQEVAHLDRASPRASVSPGRAGRRG
jgi:hypothetical protein